MRINFDMDGTIADLYGVDGWLDCLIKGDSKPYVEAKPLINMSALARRLNALQKKGYDISVVSWLAKNSTPEFDERVIKAKLEWLSKHLKSVKFDTINIVPYGTPKQKFCYTENDILFDDEPNNRMAWAGKALDEKNILQELSKIA